jgi:hypothetical protein
MSGNQRRERAGGPRLESEAGTAVRRTEIFIPPGYLDVHPITATHHHSGLVYFATAASERVTLAADEHEAIRWFSEAERQDPAFGIQLDVPFYACEGLRRAAEAPT